MIVLLETTIEKSIFRVKCLENENYQFVEVVLENETNDHFFHF